MVRGRVGRGGWAGESGHILGHPGHNEDDKLVPKKVKSLAGEVIVEVVCGYKTYDVTSTGSIHVYA
jgi:hypothetical protein